MVVWNLSSLRYFANRQAWGTQHSCSALSFHLYKNIYIMCEAGFSGCSMGVITVVDRWKIQRQLFLGSNDENEVDQTDEWSWLSFCLCDLYLIWLWREAGQPQSFDSSLSLSHTQTHTYTQGLLGQRDSFMSVISACLSSFADLKKKISKSTVCNTWCNFIGPVCIEVRLIYLSSARSVKLIVCFLSHIPQCCSWKRNNL